ncbi:MAG TPA: DUF1579 family protein [Thermoanaerobaculia bacterium]
MKIGFLALGMTAMIAVAAMSSSVAQPATKPSPPAAGRPSPAPELDQLKYFEGEWTCTGQIHAGPARSPHVTQATLQVKKDIGGFWYTGRYEEKTTAENPHPFVFVWAWGFDRKAKIFTQDGFDSFGGHGRETSSGWQEGKLAFASESTSGRDTFTKKSDSELEHRGETQAQGKSIETDRETCRRTGS